MNKAQITEIFNQLTPGLNFIFGPPSFGKTTLCKNLEKLSPKVVHATFDITSEEAGEYGSQIGNHRLLLTIKRIINLMKKNANNIIYVIDIHPYFFKVVLSLLTNFKSITMTLLMSQPSNRDEVLSRYINNGGGDPWDALMEYHEEFIQCTQKASVILKPKRKGTISLHKNFVIVKI